MRSPGVRRPDGEAGPLDAVEQPGLLRIDSPGTLGYIGDIPSGQQAGPLPDVASRLTAHPGFFPSSVSLGSKGEEYRMGFCFGGL